MSKLKLFLGIISALFFSLLVGYGLVFAGPLVTKSFLTPSSGNIFKDSFELSGNKVVLTTSDSPFSFDVSGDCLITGKYIKSNGNHHLFDLSLGDKDCTKNKIDVFFKSTYKTLSYTFNIVSDYSLYNKYLDYSTEDIEILLSGLKKEILEINNGVNLDDKNIRYKQELIFFESFFSKILNDRKQKYKIPVVGGKLPSRETKVPNSLRPYRDSYTDGVHHGWDFDGKMRSDLLAIDDGIIIRVIDGFKNQDFLKLKRKGNITEKDKLLNLDILRGNQVWIKTMKGDVAIYSHLDKVSKDIKVGDFVKKGSFLGNLGVTGVPEEGYSDYHLHIAIHKNPLNTMEAGNYNFIDIMAWPWYFKGKTAKYVLEHQSEIFEEK